MKRIPFDCFSDKQFFDANVPPCKQCYSLINYLFYKEDDFIMYEKYLLKLEEAGKIRNLKESSITCYRNYVSHFLNYVGKNPEELTC